MRKNDSATSWAISLEAAVEAEEGARSEGNNRPPWTQTQASEWSHARKPHEKKGGQILFLGGRKKLYILKCTAETDSENLIWVRTIEI